MSRRQYVIVVCPVCELESDGNYTKRKAIEEWNTRPIEAQLRAELDRMTEALSVKFETYDYDLDYNICAHCEQYIADTSDHRDDCPVREAEAIRAKYGFDKEEK
jgi:hypothetical protein